jgi:hypothetical protein
MAQELLRALAELSLETLRQQAGPPDDLTRTASP